MSNANDTIIISGDEPSGQEGQPPPTQVGDGFLVGTEQPAITRRRSNAQTTDGEGQPAQMFTAEQIEKARSEERDKLMGRLNKMEGTLSTLQEERESALKARQEAEDAAAAAAAEKERAEMDVTTRLATMEKEFQDRFNQFEEERQRQEAILEKERRINVLEAHRQQRLNEHRDDILPQLFDYIRGDSEDEIDQAILEAMQRSQAVYEEAAQRFGAQRMQMRGPSLSGAPPVGPLEDSGSRSYSADEIHQMTMDEYAKHRDKLKAAGRQQFYSR